jgi:hypothetical protein
MNAAQRQQAVREGVVRAALFVEGGVLAVSAFALHDHGSEAPFRAFATEATT